MSPNPAAPGQLVQSNNVFSSKIYEHKELGEPVDWRQSAVFGAKRANFAACFCATFEPRPGLIFAKWNETRRRSGTVGPFRPRQTAAAVCFFCARRDSSAARGAAPFRSRRKSV